ncbi:hypothetical protein EJ05DRAFT_65607 [Pseudovirgaria hyperparasitica]|uniref:Uncharacterized protein n=1 Tax=Pseudovirgaria hyperparasitica TaxID=470096 RepID=A0A6A6W2W6_9PEZI|nr:uncharacterized protein EJ05DRAFT_65607 [Pseudovirgaria hyperparasitica]KAF2756469.1 hypothetical protein EJ05DRAFT_65607 [Pseudovirgaria hyperparasitica]
MSPREPSLTGTTICHLPSPTLLLIPPTHAHTHTHTHVHNLPCTVSGQKSFSRFTHRVWIVIVVGYTGHSLLLLLTGTIVAYDNSEISVTDSRSDHDTRCRIAPTHSYTPLKRLLPTDVLSFHVNTYRARYPLCCRRPVSLPILLTTIQHKQANPITKLTPVRNIAFTQALFFYTQSCYFD